MRNRYPGTRTFLLLGLLLTLLASCTGGSPLARLFRGRPTAEPSITATPTPSRPKGTAVGQEAPDFELPTLSGDKLRLSDYRGQVVLLNFWFVGCPACRWETPHLIGAQERYRERGFTVLAVNMYDPPSLVKAFADQYQMTFPLALDQENLTSRYHIRGLYPTSFILDRDGVVVQSVVGAMDLDTMAQMIEPLLGS